MTVDAAPENSPEALHLTEPMSPFNAYVGFRLVEWRPGYAKCELALRPEHLNRSGVVHGGVFMTMLDMVCSFAGQYPLEPGQRRKALSLSMSTQFIGQAVGGTLTGIAEVKGGGSSIFFAHGRIVDEQGTLIATAEATFKYRKSS